MSEIKNPIKLKQIDSAELEQFIRGIIDTHETENIDVIFGADAIPSDVNTHFIEFPSSLSTVPKVFGSLSNEINNDILGFQIYNITEEGFTLVLSTVTPDANFIFNYIATTADGSFPLNYTKVTGA